MSVVLCMAASGSQGNADEPWVPTQVVTSTVDKLVETMTKAGGAAALESVKDRFAPAPASAAQLAIQIDELVKTLGAPRAWNLIGTRPVQRSERIFDAVVMMYHDVAPSLWVVVFYKRESGWTILKVSFSTDDVVERSRALLD